MGRDDLKSLSDDELARWTAQWNHSAPQRLLGEQQFQRRASAPPPGKWHDSALGKVALSVMSALVGAAALWAVLFWSGWFLQA